MTVSSSYLPYEHPVCVPYDTNQAAVSEPNKSRLRKRFVDTAQDPDIMPLLSVIEGLMRFRPSDRISAREALQLLE